MKLAIYQFSNNEEEGMEEEWLRLEKAILGRFDADVDKLLRERESFIERMKKTMGEAHYRDEIYEDELEEYDLQMDEIKHHKKKARKMIKPEWLREMFKKS